MASQYDDRRRVAALAGATGRTVDRQDDDRKDRRGNEDERRREDALEDAKHLHLDVHPRDLEDALDEEVDGAGEDDGREPDRDEERHEPERPLGRLVARWWAN